MAVTSVLAALAGCTVHQSEEPPLNGPSELALSVQVTATPDSINQDGSSQSLIQVTVHDANGQLRSGQSVRLDMMVGTTLQDFGTLSQRTVQTGADVSACPAAANKTGLACAIFTAPPAPPAGTPATVNRVSIVATLVSTNANVTSPLNGPSVTPRADIRLTPVGLIVPPIQFVPNFTFSPTSPTVGQSVAFDASSTTNPAKAILSYTWSFGDGTSAVGVTATHTYTSANTFAVTLTVTDSFGSSLSTIQSLSVSLPAAPTASFTVSPSAPTTADTVEFNASGSTAAPGHNIVQYKWDFGEPGCPASSTSNVSVNFQFCSTGTFTVVLSITDDTGQKASTSQSVTVK